MLKGRVRGMFTNIQFQILRKISQVPPDYRPGCWYAGQSKLTALMGDDFFARIAGRIVIDFGCGEGADAVEMAERGARQVIGLDIREEILQTARQRAAKAGIQNCVFQTSTAEAADVVVSVDAFEHFGDPGAILHSMGELLRVEGEAFVSFGPTWYHPLGGHIFSVFPWAHLLFSEKALIAWRSTFKTDGATRFCEVAGGLNQMTIARFEELVAGSPFQFASFELVPIRKLRPLHNRLTREFTTAFVRCRLVKRR